MATVTQRVSAVLNETIVVSFDWENTTGDVVAVRVANGAAVTVTVLVQGNGSGPAGRSRQGTFGPGTTVVNIPSGQRPRMPVVANPETGVPEIGELSVSMWVA